MKFAANMRQGSLIVGLGCLVLICASSLFNLWFIDSLHDTSFHRSQMIWLVVGSVGAGVAATLDMAFIRRMGLPFYAGLCLLLVAVLLFGREINHSRRWLELGPMNMQPSEFMKLGLVLMLADWFDERRSTKEWPLRRLLMPLMLVGAPVLLINLEPDLGTSLCVSLIGGSIILYEGVRKQTLIAGALVLLVGVPIAWRMGAVRDYQKGRVQAWMALDESAVNRRHVARASQSEQALWAVGSGRMFGRDLEGASRSVLRHLPFLYTDFALASWAELFGLVGTLALFGLFLGLIWWGIYLANRATERYDALVAIGVSALIFWQFFINAGMVIGLLPVVGMTLPLMSYGGSSVLTVLSGCGLLLNIALRRRPHA